MNQHPFATFGRRVPMTTLSVLLFAAGLAAAHADRPATFASRNEHIQRNRGGQSADCSPRSASYCGPSYRSSYYSGYPVSTYSYSGLSRNSYSRGSYYRSGYGTFGGVFTGSTLSRSNFSRFGGLDYSRFGFRPYHYSSQYAYQTARSSPSVYIIYPGQNLVYVPVLLSFGVVDDVSQSPEALAEAARRNNSLRDGAWEALEGGHTKQALATFTRLCTEVPEDAAAHVGFAVSAALDHNYHTAAWAMRRAFRDSAIVPTELELDPTLTSKLQGLAKRYEARVEQYGGEYADGQFMLGAFAYLLSDHALAQRATADAIAAGDRDPSTRNLNQLVQQSASLPYIADNRDY